MPHKTQKTPLSRFQVRNRYVAYVERYAALQYRNRVPDEISVDQRFERLQNALRRDHEKDVQDVIWSFSAALNNWAIADEVVERLLVLLADEGMDRSPFSGTLLQFLQIESDHLTDHQKWLCIRFLNKNGDNFKDGYGSLIVGELRSGLYLRMKKPNPQQWDDYQKMHRS